MLRLFLILLFSFIIHSSDAQVQKIIIGVNGLTCSQCSKSVYNKLIQLDFIQKVEMDLNEHTAMILLKNENEYNIDKLSNAVIDAGYSVRNIIVYFRKEGLQFADNYWIHADNRFYFDKEKNKNLPENFQVEIIGKKYNSDKKLNRMIPEEFLSVVGKAYFVLIR